MPEWTFLHIRAHEEAGLPVFPELIREVPVPESNIPDILKQMKQEDAGFTAIFAFSDSMAGPYQPFFSGARRLTAAYTAALIRMLEILA